MNKLDLLFKNKILVIFIYCSKFKKNNFIEFKEFKKLIYSAKFCIDSFIKINIKIPNKKYFLGKGKLNEIKNLIKKEKYSLLIINKVLKNSQENNLKNFLKCSLIDRTNLILILFKKIANTQLVKLQIELAYLNYLSTRLVKYWSHLERQKGGIKSIYGPGEKQIEIDRRLIKKKIRNNIFRLNKITKQRDRSNLLRNKLDISIVSLVGYTNSGKSTLFNLLTKSDIYVKNVFFSTLDTYIRKIKYFNFSNKILLSDTIGFISDFPKVLLSSFHTTLNEINNSKLILHIIDISNIYFRNYIDIVNETLDKINISNNIPIIEVMNKIDKINCVDKVEFNNGIPYRIWVSAKYNLGIKNLCKYILDFFVSKKKIYKFFLDLKYYILVNDYLYKNNYIKDVSSLDGKNYIVIIVVTKVEFFKLIKKYSFIKKFICI